MRITLSEAAHHMARRAAFDPRPAGQPLMRAVVAELATGTEAATRLAGVADRSERAFP